MSGRLRVVAWVLAALACGCSAGGGESSKPGAAGAGGGAGARDAAAGTGGGSDTDAKIEGAGDVVVLDGSLPDASISDAAPDGPAVDRSTDVYLADAREASVEVDVDAGPPRHRLMVSEYPGRIMEVSAEGKLVWEHKTPTLSVMFTVLPNGNVFYPHGAPTPGAEEVDRNHTVVWSYASTAGELLGGERLANGNTLLGQGGPALALELGPGKQVVRSIAVPTSFAAAHGQVRHVHRLDNGHVLAALEGEGAVREIDATGATVWEYKGLASVHDALRLPNGNTLIGGGQSKRVVEVTPQGQVAWELDAAVAAKLGLAWVCNVQVLKSGNLFVTNWVGAGGGAGVHAFEVTRDQRVVYTFDDHTLVKSATTVIVLDD